MRKQIIGLFCMVLFFTVELKADVRPANIFGDHMVLQREIPVPVWGTAEPGEKVTVEFAGQSKSAVADKNGKWMVKLDALKADAKGKGLVVSGKNKIVLKDVLVGEVWICTGQSNMVWSYKRIKELTPLFTKAVDEKRLLRSLMVPQVAGLEPRADIRKAAWRLIPCESAVGFGFSYYLQEALDIPVAVIQAAWGSTPIESWLPIEMTEQLPHFKSIMEKFALGNLEKLAAFLKEDEEQYNKLENPPWKCASPHDVGFRTKPNIVYNGLLHPIIPYAARGMVWYQGGGMCGGIGFSNPELYGKTLQLWIKHIRKLWGRDDFHYLVVPRPAFYKKDINDPKLDMPHGNWLAWLREAQSKSTELPDVGVITAVDLPGGIHSNLKEPIGKRLSLLAQYDIYGQDIVSRGPVMSGHKIVGSKFIIEFKYADGLTTKDGKAPAQFWMAGEDRKWVRADKTVVKGNTVEVEATGLANPVAVRYAFASCPKVNLVNGAGLPAYPFRTDDWPQK
ncbi:sialate O-acetylesterase [Verrucomicrobiota bacterium]